MRIRTIAVICGISIFPFSGNAAAVDKNEWTRDCVGYLEIRLPDKAEVAATAYDQLLHPTRTVYSEFEDGQVAPYSTYHYVGAMQVTRALSEEEIQRFLSEAKRTRAQYQADAESYQKIDANMPEAAYQEFNLPKDDGVAIRRFKYLYAARSMNRHAFKWGMNAPDDRVPEFVQFMNKLINTIALREDLTVPSGSGLCMPHLFIPIDGPDRYGHTIATTYRLKSHPDVTVMLEDASAKRPLESQDPAKLTAVYKSNFFWTQDYRSYDSIKNLLTLRRHNTIDFAGQKGVESMVSMIRKDKVTEDYGYLVVTQGDPDARNDKPELMFYVIRDAKNAEKRGMKPIGKDEFFKLAREIAASVKRRTVP
ncbi:T6SS immunity protein Tli4 family protein [uncultured Herbaspirillum sp.]|uniref:T6SS immunity protein Tli4 family protein n=1 Tax=uncultured Herbaspirillum sp. TaxID=160236 RepID=UPI00258BCC81|nr:T6SS immunity protein Tli4 family protein [uncultured Herbaspirillum sp.]